MPEGGLTLVFDEHFSHYRSGSWRPSRAAPNVTWMPQAVGEEFVIVTADRNERTREITVEEFRRMGARVLLVGSFWDHRGRWAQAKWLVARLERLIGTATGMGAGDVLLVAADGKIRAAE